MVIDLPYWRSLIIDYFKSLSAFTDSQSAKLRIRAVMYSLINDILYKKLFTLSYLRCLGLDEAGYALREIHERICGQHLRGHALAHKALRQVYYWSTIKKDTTDFVKKCDKCQRFAKTTHKPPEQLSNIIALWPFTQWGLDILRPFPLVKA